LPGAAVAAPPRFLAPFDNAILSHADRTRIVAEDDRRTVARDRLMRTFLVDGFVAGSWRLEGGNVHLEPFRPLSARDRRELELEAHDRPEPRIPDPDDGRMAVQPARQLAGGGLGTLEAQGERPRAPQSEEGLEHARRGSVQASGFPEPAHLLGISRHRRSEQK